MKEIGLIILAAGKGTRMNQDSPKVLAELGGVSLIENLLNTIRETKYINDVCVVVGFKGEEVVERLGDKYNFAWQKEQLGTGHAVAQCKDLLQGKYENYLVLYGDTPFISKKTIDRVLDLHKEKKSILTMVTLKLDHFDGSNKNYYHFGRIKRDKDGNILKIVEFKDATDDEKNITELNPAIYCVKDSWLWDNLEKIKNNNNQKEYYLTDLVGLAHNDGIAINSFVINDGFELMGVNTVEELDVAKRVYDDKKI